jgi:hypothetical protein
VPNLFLFCCQKPLYIYRRWSKLSGRVWGTSFVFLLRIWRMGHILLQFWRVLDTWTLSLELGLLLRLRLNMLLVPLFQLRPSKNYAETFRCVENLIPCDHMFSSWYRKVLWFYCLSKKWTASLENHLVQMIPYDLPSLMKTIEVFIYALVE